MKRISKHVLREQVAVYGSEDKVIRAALDILADRLIVDVPVLKSPETVRNYLKLNLAPLEHEEFWVMYLDNRLRLIASESVFRGTLSQTSVYPREIAKRALHFNAGFVFLAHNHPSGFAEPSRADEALTRVLVETLKMVDVRVMDHFIVGGCSILSFAERGLL